MNDDAHQQAEEKKWVMRARYQDDERRRRSDRETESVAVPNHLYHYTTLAGLQGIVETGGLWASDVRYMNDSSELVYAHELIQEVVHSKFSAVENNDLAQILEKYEDFATDFSYESKPYITCFCETDDLLSQWRGYSSQDVGVSLGFNFQMTALLGDLPPNTVLRKVVYDEGQQRAELESIVSTWLQTTMALLDEGAELAALFSNPAVIALQSALRTSRLSFKHPTFREENEWRLIKSIDTVAEVSRLEAQRTNASIAEIGVVLGQYGIEFPGLPSVTPPFRTEGVEISFRRSALGLIPYVNMVIPDRAGVFHGRLPITSVRVGPSAHPQLAMESIALYLKSRGYGHHTDLLMSGVPLRY
ncbi:DUF2971 domain-containing protein [Rathayibacter sp. Leaf248]|uniref:DUF2971 domain-containing protein n=1 Tax=Rathayibacter sp. Leaf248 TaxID=2876555 RepID=UPI001E60F8B9|nr:DUF2971 domain-containing protein [Rathayibacter sp. Leaf248]